MIGSARVAQQAPNGPAGREAGPTWQGDTVIVGLGHVDLVCRDLERSLAFYAAVFGPLGLQEPALFDGERGERIHYLRFPAAGSGSLGLRQALEEQEFELYAPGFHHLALTVESRADVDAAYEAAIAAGAQILHPPRPWPQYHPQYYAAFFLDPDGFRVEVSAARDARL
jgi:catechol 2,3-dioxygenase-like lactoylglutathione lyase family enzyme